jgi:hypothetical protein
MKVNGYPARLEADLSAPDAAPISILRALGDGGLVEHMPGVLVATSDMWMTNTTVIVNGSRSLVVDAGLLPGALRALEDESPTGPASRRWSMAARSVSPGASSPTA